MPATGFKKIWDGGMFTMVYQNVRWYVHSDTFHVKKVAF